MTLNDHIRDVYRNGPMQAPGYNPVSCDLAISGPDAELADTLREAGGVVIWEADPDMRADPVEYLIAEAHAEGSAVRFRVVFDGEWCDIPFATGFTPEGEAIPGYVQWADRPAD